MDIRLYAIMHKDFWKERIRKYGIRYVGDKRHTEQEHIDFYNRKKEFIKKHIPKHKKILDFGCGVGMYADLFDRNKYLGVDIVSSDFKVGYNHRSIEAYEKIPEKVDLILCVNVLQHIKDFEKAICSWNIDKGHILLMENRKDNNVYTFARYMVDYINTIEKYFKIKSYVYDYLEGSNLFIKIKL